MIEQQIAPGCRWAFDMTAHDDGTLDVYSMGLTGAKAWQDLADALMTQAVLVRRGGYRPQEAELPERADWMLRLIRWPNGRTQTLVVGDADDDEIADELIGQANAAREQVRSIDGSS